MMNIYNEVFKEIKTQLNKASRDETRLAMRKNKEKEILTDFLLLAKEKIEIDKSAKVIDPLATLK